MSAVDVYSYEYGYFQGRRSSNPMMSYTQPNSCSVAPRRYSIQGSPNMFNPARQVLPHHHANYPQKQPVRPMPQYTLPAPPVQQIHRKEGFKPLSDASSHPELARYKTELCRPFEETGECRYGSKCQFAHGPSELRSLNRHPKYKTEFCRTFHSTGFCSYGPRCNFIHDDDAAALKANVQRPNPPQTQRPQNLFINPQTAPLTINSSGESPASSVSGGSPSQSPGFLKDDVFTHRLSPTPSFGSDCASLTSSNFPTPPGSPKVEAGDTSLLSSPLDMGFNFALFSKLTL